MKRARAWGLHLVQLIMSSSAIRDFSTGVYVGWTYKSSPRYTRENFNDEGKSNAERDRRVKRRFHVAWKWKPERYGLGLLFMEGGNWPPQCDGWTPPYQRWVYSSNWNPDTMLLFLIYTVFQVLKSKWSVFKPTSKVTFHSSWDIHQYSITK